MSDLTHAVIRARLTALHGAALALRHHERNEHQHPNSAMAFACASVLGQQLDSALAACADLDTLVAALRLPPGEYICTRCGLREQRGEAPKGDF